MDVLESKTRSDMIKRLINYLEEFIPQVTNENAMTGGSFLGFAGLYRMNRYLKAIYISINAGVGDTAGGNLRTLYETWILSHLLLLSTYEEARKIWGFTINLNSKVMKAINVDIDYTYDMPEKEFDKGVMERAKDLQKKLEIDDPTNAQVPLFCYDHLFRGESLLSSHANITSLSQYVDGSTGLIGLRSNGDNFFWRSAIATSITLYFAKRVFIQNEFDTSQLDEISKKFDVQLV